MKVNNLNINLCVKFELGLYFTLYKIQFHAKNENIILI